MGLFLATLQAFVIMMLISTVVMILTMAVTVFLVRRKTNNKIYIYFLEPNNQITRELVPVNGAEKVSSQGGGDYIITPAKVKWSKWPPGLPNWAQEIVPTMFCVRNNMEPFDPMSTRSAITANSLRYITDEGMLRATWSDAREATKERGLGGQPRWVTWLSIGTAAGTAALGIGLWLLFSAVATSAAQVKELLDIVKGL